MNIGVSSKLALAFCSFKVDIHRKKSYQIVNAGVFPLTFYNLGKCSKTHRIGRAWEIGTHTFLIALVHFFLSDSHVLVYFIICKMHGLPHQFAIAWENDAKLIEQGEPGKWISIIFP